MPLPFPGKNMGQEPQWGLLQEANTTDVAAMSLEILGKLQQRLGVQAYGHVNAYTCWEYRLTSGVAPREPSPLLFETGSLTGTWGY